MVHGKLSAVKFFSGQYPTDGFLTHATPRSGVTVRTTRKPKESMPLGASKMSRCADRAIEGGALKQPPRTMRQSSSLTGNGPEGIEGGAVLRPSRISRVSLRTRRSRPGTTPTGSPACRRGRTRWARAGRPGRAVPASSTRSRRTVEELFRLAEWPAGLGLCPAEVLPLRLGREPEPAAVTVSLREFHAGLDLVREERFEPGFPAQPVAVADRLVP